MFQINTRGPIYDPEAVQPMRDELTAAGFIELITPADVDKYPVSYTHLDVYKRQALTCVILARIFMHFPATRCTDQWVSAYVTAGNHCSKLFRLTRPAVI